MAQSGVDLLSKTLSCPICLDVLKDPTTLLCGHSFCMTCIKVYWDVEDQKGIPSCPQCRRSFVFRPELVKNTVLAAVVEELRPQAADHCYAAADDVACDICSGRKMKAVMSCTVCLSHYCDTHLQPHRNYALFKMHRLLDSSKIQQKCRAATQQMIRDKVEDMKVLQQEVKHINCSADEAVEHSQKIGRRLTRVMEEINREVMVQIRNQQETEVSRIKGLQEKLEQDIAELRSKDAQMVQLMSVLRLSASPGGGSTYSSSIHKSTSRYFEDMMAAMSESSQKLHNLLRDTRANILKISADLLLSEPETRAKFLGHSHDITLDLMGNRRATCAWNRHSNLPVGVRTSHRVLSSQSDWTRYWEVKWSGYERRLVGENQPWSLFSC